MNQRILNLLQGRDRLTRPYLLPLVRGVKVDETLLQKVWRDYRWKLEA
jgi:hypothetical protein